MRWGTAEQVVDRWQRVRPDACVLSVDVFDTLLRRLVSPDAVVEAAVYQIADAIGAGRDEVSAHRQAWRARHDGGPTGRREWRLADWLRALAGVHGLDEDMVVTAGLAAEASVEAISTTPDATVTDVIAAARTRGWRVIAVSDTWHEQDALEALLSHHGLEVDRVFSSATLGRSKRDGTVFGAVEAALGVEASAIVHFGDNWKADLVRPKLAGWWSRWRPMDPGPLVRRFGTSPARALAAPRCSDADPLVRVGYTCLAPLVLAHAVVARRVEERSRIDAAIYLARDMPAFVDARRLLDGRVGDARPAMYLRVSRRALSLAHPDDLLGRAAGVAGRVGKSTVGGLMGGFDLDPDLRDRLLERSDLTPATAWTTDVRRAFVRACAAERHAIDMARAAQSERLRRWVRQHVGSASRVAIYDTGWAGTAQDAIAAACPDLEYLAGVYLGVNAQGRRSGARSTKRGLAWDDAAGHRPRSAWVRSAGCIRLLEVLLREPVPSVRRLVDGANGAVDVERTAGSDLTPAAIDAARRLKRGIDAGVSARLDGVVAGVRLDVDVDDAAWIDAIERCYEALLARPSRAFAEAMLALPYEEGGTVESTSSLGLVGWRAGTTWWPGVVAAKGAGPMATVAEPIAGVVSSVRSRR